MWRSISSSLFLAGALLLWACGSDDTPGAGGLGGSPAGAGGGGGQGGEGGHGGEGGAKERGRISEIRVTPTEVILFDGDTVQLHALVFDERGEPAEVEVSWSSDRPDVAEVDSSGLVAAIGDGVATISASAGGRSGSARVEVDLILPARIQIEPPRSSSIINDTVTVQVDLEVPFTVKLWDAFDNPLEGRQVRWSIEPFELEEDEDPREVGRVGDDGVLVAMWPGKHRLIAAAGGRSASLGINAVLRFREVAPGTSQTCALSTGDKAWCWGDNEMGQLGIGEFTRNLPINDSPLRVAGDRSYTTISSGLRHSCAIDFEGRAWCWGRAFDGEIDASGQAPSGWVVGAKEPVLVELTEGPLVSIRARGTSTCALSAGGVLQCWGRIALPWDHGRINRVADFDLGWRGDFVCFLREEAATDDIYCFGENGMEQVGVPEDPADVVNRRIRPYHDAWIRFFSIATGYEHACAMMDGPTALCWGAAGSGETGRDGASVDPNGTMVRGSAGLEQLALGDSFSCGLLEGEVHCWGRDVAGIGDTSTSVATHVPFPKPIGSLSVGQNMICGLSDEPAPILYCLGRNEPLEHRVFVVNEGMLPCFLREAGWHPGHVYVDPILHSFEPGILGPGEAKSIRITSLSLIDSGPSSYTAEILLNTEVYATRSFDFTYHATGFVPYATPTQLIFDPVPAGEAATLHFVISDPSAMNVFDSIGVSEGSSDSFTLLNATHPQGGPVGGMRVEVSFAPEVSGYQHGQVELHLRDFPDPVRVDLLGLGLDPNP